MIAQVFLDGGNQLRIPAMTATNLGRYPASVPDVTPPMSERSDAELLVR